MNGLIKNESDIDVSTQSYVASLTSFFLSLYFIQTIILRKPLSSMNTSDLNHQKDSFYECIKQTYD